MKLGKAFRNIAVLGALAALLGGFPAQAAEYPTKEIRIIQPYPSGGFTDVVTRKMAEVIAQDQLLSKDILAVAITGANTRNALQTVLDAAPDGYTLLMHHTALVATKVSGQLPIGYTDFEMLGGLCAGPIAIDVMKAYGGGDLLSDANSPFGRPMTPVQCLEYALTRPGVAAVMAGCRSRAEIEAALGWCSATAAERDYTGALAGLDKFSWEGHCMYCGHCAPCSVGIDIAGVNKYYNLTLAQHEIPETVREHYRLLPHHASECIACGRCERNCPFGVDIIGHMRLAAAKFGY